MRPVMDLVVGQQNDELEQKYKGKKAQHPDGGLRHTEYAGHYQENKDSCNGYRNTHVLDIMTTGDFLLQPERFSFFAAILIVDLQ